MNHSVLYLSVIQFYLLNHTQNVISGRNNTYKITLNLVWDSQHWPVNGIVSGRTGIGPALVTVLHRYYSNLLVYNN